jgi:hypothetical protein
MKKIKYLGWKILAGVVIAAILFIILLVRAWMNFSWA